MTDIDDVVAEHAAPTNGRRELLTKGAVAAAVAAVAGVAVARPASAANGDTIHVAGSHTGSGVTKLTGSMLQVIDGATPVLGIGTPAIYGYSAVTDGVGVLGVATGTNGRGVYGRSSSTNGAGVYGEATGTGGNGVRGSSNSSGAGVYGSNDGTTTGTGVFGRSDIGTGVLGRADDGDGVVGRSATGTGVVADGGALDIAALGSGRVLVGGTGVSNPPATGAAGTIARDGDGNLWFAYATDQWRKLAGPGTAGSFHPIEPARVYDSRLGAYAPNDGLMASNTDRVVSVKDARDASGVIMTPDVVPTGATAVAINVTVAGPTGPNFLSVVPGDATGFFASTINWPGGFDCANGAIVKLDGSRQLKVFCGDQSGSTHVIIDVTGYYA